MNLFQNPFFIIGVSTRDSKQSIVDACDTKSLTVDPDICTRSRAVLTQPRNRLSAELAWLPGYSPVGAKVLIEKIQKEPAAFLSSLDGMAPLPRCNALATFLEHHKPSTESQIAGLLIDVAQSFERIDYAKLMAAINEDRQIAKIPSIQEVENIKQEMQARREYIIGVMKGCLNNTKAPDKVLTKIVETTTSEGRQHPPMLIEELTDKYQVEVQKYLDQLVGQIRNVIERIREKPKQSFEYQMPTLYKFIKTWDQIAQPIQLVHQSKGLDDPHSKELAEDLRGLALEIANTYDMHAEAKQITKIVAELFKELPQFADKFSEDLTALEDIIDHKTKNKEEEQQWREQCSLNIEFGTVFKKKFIITPEVIKFKDDQMQTDKVNRVRWSSTATQHRINGIPTGTTYSYSVWIGQNQKTFHIEPPDGNLYNMIVDRLWKAVCIRLLTETLAKLSAGEYVTYGNGDAIVNKDGIMLKKHKLFGHDPYFAKWEDLRIGNGNGTFVVSSDSEKKAKAELSYKDTDNVHVFEAITRFLFKDGNHLKLRRGEFSK
jgi:hypothetical protein